jgi:apolipoprotein N-acyltransferase
VEKLFQKVLKIALQLISLLVVALGQPAFFTWAGPFAASIGLALHWKSLEGFSSKKMGRVSFFWFFCVQLIQLAWMARLEYQGLYILALYFLLSMGLALQFAFLTKMVYKVPRFNFFYMGAIAGLWTLFEWSRLHILCGFAFNFLGLSLSCTQVSLQMASLFGILGMSFWVILTNLASLRLFRKPSISHGTSLGILILLPCLYGFFHIEYHDVKSKSEKRTALLVQTSLTPSQKYSLKGRESEFIYPMQQWERILQSVAVYKDAEIDLLVLPEAALPYGLDLYIYQIEKIQGLFKSYFGERVASFFPLIEEPFAIGERVSNAYVLQTLAQIFAAPTIAGLDYQKETGEFYNSAFCFEPKAAVSPKRYDKRVLLPLAECMPFSCLTALSKYYGIKDFFTQGSQSEVFSLGESLLVSPSICYEELFPALMREGRKKGAELFVNLSNDGWYPSSKLPMQHFTQGLIRSVENGVPSIRACNTGVTGVVDSFGRIVKILQGVDGDVENVSGCLLVNVPKENHVTGFVVWGEIPLILGSFFWVFFALLKFFREQGTLGNRS